MSSFENLSEKNGAVVESGAKSESLKCDSTVSGELSSVTERVQFIEDLAKWARQEISVLDPAIAQTVQSFEKCDIWAQAAAIKAMEALQLDTTGILRAFGVEHKFNSSGTLEATVDRKFIDPSLYRVTRGHYVEMVVEVPLEGVSRHQAEFLAKLSVDADLSRNTIIGIDGSNPEIKAILGNDPSTETLGIQNDSIKDSIPDQVPARGLAGLMWMNCMHPDHPGFIRDPLKIKAMINGMLPKGFKLENISGFVEKPPNGSNSGMLTMTDGQAFEMCNIRFLNIVGADIQALLERAPDEIYLGKRVRIWWEPERRWIEGSVEQPDAAHGLVQIRSDERVHDNLDFYGGHGVTIGQKSSELDLRDLSLNRPKHHPALDYPKLARGRVVSYVDDEGTLCYGEIYQINWGEKELVLCDSEYITSIHPLDFNCDYLTETVVPGRNEARVGNKISYYDIEDGIVRVYDIIGVDPKHNKVIAKIVSLRPPLAPSCYSFDLDDSNLTIVDMKAGLAERARRFPCLDQYRRYSGKKYGIRFRDVNKNNRDTVAELFEADTYPFYFEAAQRKEPNEFDSNSDVHQDFFHRYRVNPDDVIEIFNI